MRGDDAPTLGKAYPALALSLDAAVAQELGVGGGEVVAVGGDDRLAQLALGRVLADEVLQHHAQLARPGEVARGAGAGDVVVDDGANAGAALRALHEMA